MGYVRVDNGTNLPLQVILSDGNSAMFPQAKVYSISGTLLTTLSLTNVSGGLYTNTTYTPSNATQYFSVYTIYQDAGHTIAAAYNVTEDFFDVRQLELSSTVWTNTRAGNLDNLDTTVSSRAAAATALSTAQWTNTRAGYLDNLTNLDTTVSSRASQTSVNSIPTNPLLTTDSRLNNLDATISSRATQSSVNAIPTTPQLAATALTQYNSLISAIGTIQNNTNFSGIVPQLMNQQFGASTEAYTFYANTFNDTGEPVDPDSDILNFAVEDNLGNTLQAMTAMTRTGTGAYTGIFTVTSSMGEADVVVFFTYSVSSVPYQQIRTSTISSTSADSANILAIKAKTDNLPSDPASNTVVNTRASQTSVNTANVNISAIEGQTNQFSFSSGNVNANTVTNQDKTGYALTVGEHTQISHDVWDATLASYQTAGSTGKALNDSAYSGTSLSPTDISNIVYGVWDEPISAHTNPNTFGSRNQVLITQGMANNLNNLDTTISSRAPASTAISSSTLTVGRITNLDNLDVPVSSRASTTALAPIAAQTALIPAVPATQGAVLAIPTNPLLTTDGRLNNLDATISSRAKPSDLAPLATTADLDNFETNITNDVNAIGASVLTRAQPSDITSAVAPLATAAEVAAVQSTVDIIAGEQITPVDVWTYGTRSLTEPVDTTDDLTPLAKTTDVTASQAAIITAVDYWQSKLTVAINPTTDQMTLVAWLELNGQALTTPTVASVNVYDPTNTLVMAVGPDDMTNFQGTFTFTRANASTVLAANQTYTCEILITNSSIVYRGITPITVF